jgi:glycosyltransferase involved in cell wall biosynthesis
VLNEVFLTVCIPVYNTDVTELVEQLFHQSSFQSRKVEIILIDDKSEQSWKTKLKSLEGKCRIIELEQNIGRSRIRNRFLNYAAGKYLLFIDGDSSIISSDFMSLYLTQLEQNNSLVLLGGSIYQKEKPERNKLLRWRYSIKRESKSAELRMKGNHAFKTNNFIVQKSIFETIKFDETLNGYGHEDTLYGIELERKRVIIDHIDNPVLNKHLDTNEVFLMKTENAIQNLLEIYEKSFKVPEIKQLKLIRFYEKLKRLRLLFLVTIFFVLTEKFLFRLLKSGNFTLWMFDFYKLGLFNRKIKS